MPARRDRYFTISVDSLCHAGLRMADSKELYGRSVIHFIFFTYHLLFIKHYLVSGVCWCVKVPRSKLSIHINLPNHVDMPGSASRSEVNLIQRAPSRYLNEAFYYAHKHNYVYMREATNRTYHIHKYYPALIRTCMYLTNSLIAFLLYDAVCMTDTIYIYIDCIRLLLRRLTANPQTVLVNFNFRFLCICAPHHAQKFH